MSRGTRRRRLQNQIRNSGCRLALVRSYRPQKDSSIERALEIRHIHGTSWRGFHRTRLLCNTSNALHRQRLGASRGAAPAVDPAYSCQRELAQSTQYPKSTPPCSMPPHFVELTTHSATPLLLHARSLPQ